MTKKLVGLISGVVVFVIILLFFDLEPGKPEITKTFAVAMLMAIWWVTEALPLAATALVPIVAFPMLGVMDGKAISGEYVNHIIFLFIGGFMMALAMERWNLHKRIALKILIWVGVSPARILLGFMLATVILSMWISNTATTMMMIPIVTSIIYELEDTLGKKTIKKYALGLLLGIAYSASIGGNATLVGTPTNLICVRLLDVLYPGAPEISFARWFIFAVPVTIIMFAAAYALLLFLYKPKEKWDNLSDETFHVQMKQLGKVSYEERAVFILFLSLAFLWISRAGIDFGTFKIPGWAELFQVPGYINDGTTAIFMALILFIVPARSEKHARLMDWTTAKRLPWNIVLLFGGGFALAAGFEDSGLSLWFGEQLNWGESIPPYVFVISIVAMMSLLTELTSNVASTQMLLPAFASIAVATGDNPLLFMIPATISSSLAFMLPTATPSNAIIFGTERVTINRMMRTGFRLNILGIIIITMITYFLIGSIFDVELGVVPEWAQP
jgi:solute carrier family 13 (sodium-dependent dicarboxylate transporter), member 2/3/5